MQVLLALIYVLLYSSVTFATNAPIAQTSGAGAKSLQRRMEPADAMSLSDESDRGYHYIELLYDDIDTLARVVTEMVREGKEVRGPRDNRQRDGLTVDDAKEWTWKPCDQPDNVDSVSEALENILPGGEAAQEDSERPRRPNVLLREPQGPNRCFVWMQEDRYIPVGGREYMVRFAPSLAVRDNI